MHLTQEQIDTMIRDAEGVRNDLNGCMRERADDVACHVKALASEVERLKKCSAENDPHLLHDLECNEKALGREKPNIYSRAIEFIRYLQAVVGAGDTAMRAMSQESEFLSREADELKATLWMAASGQPNRELFVWDRDKHAWRDRDCVLQSFEDAANRRTVIRAEYITDSGDSPDDDISEHEWREALNEIRKGVWQ